MKNIHRVTYALVALVLATAAFSIATRGSGQDEATQTDSQESAATALQKYEARKRTFPTADYDEAEPSNPSKQAARREKQKRYDKFGLVVREPHPETTETNFVGHPEVDFPALPLEKSDVIIVGNVIAGEAHLSADKKNVFSEFPVRVTKVYKATTLTVPAVDSSIVVERVGGYVRYPNGQTVLYRSPGVGMPPVGKTCVLFLNTIPPTDAYTILTGYELGVNGFEPLDFGSKFEAFRGMDVSTFLSTLADLVTKASAP